MTTDTTILAEIDPEIISRMKARPDAMRRSLLGLGALASAPVMLGALAGNAFGQGAQLPGKIRDVLNFALTLEYLEDEFYRTALAANGLIPADTRPMFEEIAKHEAAHVELLRSTLGSHAVKKPSFDFTAKGAFGDVFSNYKTFLALSQAFEDTGVRAYKGQAGALKSNDDILTIALQIHSVEARHAAQVRLVRGQKPWITSNSRGDLPEATQPIYDGEADFTQGGADIKKLGDLSLDSLSEAFDEPLSKGKVLAIAKMFIKA